MIESVGTIVINTSPDEVFRFLTHREHFLQWVRAVSGAHGVTLSEGAFGDGTLIHHTQDPLGLGDSDPLHASFRLDRGPATTCAIASLFATLE